MAPPEFNPPNLITARKSTGFVDIPGVANDEAWNGRKSFTMSPSPLEAPPSPTEKSFGPSLLQRSKTMAGNIVVLEEDGHPPRAYWLSRKIGKSPNGVIRLGYQLRPNSKPEFKDSLEAWELATDEIEEEPILVVVHIMHTSVMDMDGEGGVAHRPLDELSALQIIAKHKGSDEGHVIASSLVATCASHVYAIMPYHADGTLMQYCLENGSLDETIARFFFRQILKVSGGGGLCFGYPWNQESNTIFFLQGVQTLQETGICHRNLSLETVELSGDHLDITSLGCAMKYNKSSNGNHEGPLPLPAGSNPQLVAPEYFGNLTGSWDGFAADLWACGLILFSMVVSSEALFVAPLKEDAKYVALCEKGSIGEQASKYGKSKGIDIVLSDNLIDLLVSMLKADPKERISLDQIMEHPWVTEGEAIAPSVLEQKKVEGKQSS